MKSGLPGKRADKSSRRVRREDAPRAPRTGKVSPLPEKFTVTHPDRVIDPSADIKKVDLVSYYAKAAALMFDHLQGRPVSMVRAPEGIQGELFFQRHLEGELDGLRALPERLRPGHESMIEVAKPVGVLSAAQMNVIELHTWNATKTSIGKPDRMIFDIDPGEGVQWPATQEAALLMQTLLEKLELVPFVKTSGGKGLHVVVPLQRRHDWDTVKDFSQLMVQQLAQTFPQRFTAKSGPRNRVQKIFIDYLRNGWSATTVCAWSARARPGMGVSVPIGWDEVETLSASDQWNVVNVHDRLAVGNSPWASYAKSARPLTAAMKIFGFSRP